jgi:twitching motility two-component system response regulator PilG
VDIPLKSRAATSILVIDDSPTIRAVVELALRSEGHQTQSFPDGVTALQWLAEPGSQTPDLILVDIGLPKIDGYQIIHLLRKRPRFANTACIVLSGRDGLLNSLKGRLAGAQMYLTKPCTVQVLCQAVRDCLAGESRSEKKSV